MNSFGPASIHECATHYQPKVGVIGGSGMYELLEMNVVDRQKPHTRYGPPADEILIGEIQGQSVAFLPRHGRRHALPPHKIPYKANIAALKAVGIEYIIGTCVAVSLRQEITPGSLVIPDQFVNLTWGRDDYFESDERFLHLAMARPYCEHLRQLVQEAGVRAGITMVPRGIVVVTQGPRFSTIAESHWFAQSGWDIVNMTQYPECYFARELGICYAAVASVTDYDVGVSELYRSSVPNADIALPTFKDNIRKTKALLLSFLDGIASKLSCKCATVVAEPYYTEAQRCSPYPRG